MNGIAIDRADIDIETAEGRTAARQRLYEACLSNAKENFNLLFNAELEDHTSETIDQRIENLQNALDDIDFFEEKSKRQSITTIEWDDIDVKDREWLIPNWLPANTATLFTGDGGAGKSWLTLQAVCQIASGYTGAFIDPDFTAPKVSEADDSNIPNHIVFATYEDEPAEIKRRLHALASGFGWIAEALETIKQHFHLVDMRGVGSVWGPGLDKHISVTGDLLAAGVELQLLCEEKKARLLVMDPLSGAFGGNENDRTAVYDFVSSFRRWGDTANCAILAIGHLPKGNEGRAAGFSGSTAWEASVRSMWKVSKQTKNDDSFWRLQHTKSNYAPPQKDKYLVKSQHGWWVEVETETDAIAGQQEYEDHFKKESNDGTPDTPNF